MDFDFYFEHIKSVIETHGERIEKIKLNPFDQAGIVWVKEGLAKIYGINEKGIKINTDLIFESECYWVKEDNYLTEDQFYLQAMKFSNLVFIPETIFDEYSINLLSRCMNSFLTKRLRRIHQQKVKNFDLELEERIFFLLLDFCSIFGREYGDFYSMPNFFTHDDLSNILKNCRQNITTCLNEMKRRRVIHYDRKEIKFEKAIFEKYKLEYQTSLKFKTTISLC
jgi:CRP-like cAMP-binding protein